MLRQVVLFLGLILITYSAYCAINDSTHQEIPGLSLEIKSTIINFLSGQDAGSVLTYISGGEYYEAGPDPSSVRKMFQDSRPEFLKAVLSSNEGTAIVILKTTIMGARTYHTFVLMKNCSGKWEVKSWHSSHP